MPSLRPLFPFLPVLLLAGLSSPLRAQESAILHGFAGELKLESQGEVRVPDAGMTLLTGDVLTTGCGNAVITLEDAFSLHVLAESKLVVVDPMAARVFKTLAGKFRVTSSGGEHRISAPPGSTASLGPGRFELSVTPLGDEGEELVEASLGVAQGSAECTSVIDGATKRLTLQPGQMTVLSPWDEPLLEEFEEGQLAPPDPTQLAYAVQIVRGADLEDMLPLNATPEDSVTLLASLGIFPCAGNWEPGAPVCLEDIKCVIGLPPEDPRLSIPFDEQISLLIQNNSEIFFLQTRRRLPVSPFAP